MKYFTVLFVLLTSLITQAQKSGVHVGNAGGNGEMKALLIDLHLSQYMNVWLSDQSCDLSLKPEVVQFIQQDQRKFKFVNAGEFKRACDQEFIFITHESLYDLKQAKNDFAILNEVLSGYASCFSGLPVSIKAKSSLSPVPVEVIEGELFNFSGPDHDFLYFKNFSYDIDGESKMRLGCNKYRLAESYENNVFLLTCAESENQFLMKAILQNEQVSLKWKSL